MSIGGADVRVAIDQTLDKSDDFLGDVKRALARLGGCLRIASAGDDEKSEKGECEECSSNGTRATPNDPKLSDGRGWRGPCMAGGKAAAEAASVTAGAVRCSAWLGVAVILELCEAARS